MLLINKKTPCGLLYRRFQAICIYTFLYFKFVATKDFPHFFFCFLECSFIIIQYFYSYWTKTVTIRTNPKRIKFWLNIINFTSKMWSYTTLVFIDVRSKLIQSVNNLLYIKLSWVQQWFLFLRCSSFCSFNEFLVNWLRQY